MKVCCGAAVMGLLLCEHLSRFHTEGMFMKEDYMDITKLKM